MASAALEAHDSWSSRTLEANEVLHVTARAGADLRFRIGDCELAPNRAKSICRFFFPSSCSALQYHQWTSGDIEYVRSRRASQRDRDNMCNCQNRNWDLNLRSPRRIFADLDYIASHHLHFSGPSYQNVQIGMQIWRVI